MDAHLDGTMASHLFARTSFPESLCDKHQHLAVSVHSPSYQYGMYPHIHHSTQQRAPGSKHRNCQTSHEFPSRPFRLIHRHQSRNTQLCPAHISLQLDSYHVSICHVRWCPIELTCLLELGTREYSLRNMNWSWLIDGFPQGSVGHTYSEQRNAQARRTHLRRVIKGQGCGKRRSGNVVSLIIQWIFSERR